MNVPMKCIHVLVCHLQSTYAYIEDSGATNTFIIFLVSGIL